MLALNSQRANRDSPVRLTGLLCPQSKAPLCTAGANAKRSATLHQQWADSGATNRLPAGSSSVRRALPLNLPGGNLVPVGLLGQISRRWQHSGVCLEGRTLREQQRSRLTRCNNNLAPQVRSPPRLQLRLRVGQCFRLRLKRRGARLG